MQSVMHESGAVAALDRVQSVAEQIQNDETAVVGTVSPGDVIRQGDLYVVCVTGRMPTQAKLTPTNERQLAPGTSQGSRHVLHGECNVATCATPADAEAVIATIAKVLHPRPVELFPPLIGPIFTTEGQVELTHPEHGNRVLPAGETFVTVYQRAFADEVRRQLD